MEEIVSDTEIKLAEPGAQIYDPAIKYKYKIIPEMSQSIIRDQTASSDKEIKTLLELRKIFHMELLMMTLHLRDTREKMMNTLNTQGSKEWTTVYILKLATHNKIKWIQGSDDPTPFDTYQKEMNSRLAEILSS